MIREQLSIDKLELELLRNTAVINLLNIIGHHAMLSVIELLVRKFTLIEVDYAIEKGVIAFNRPNPNTELTSNERVDKSTVNSWNTCCYHHILKRHVKLTALGHRMLLKQKEVGLNRD